MSDFRAGVRLTCAALITLFLIVWATSINAKTTAQNQPTAAQDNSDDENMDQSATDDQSSTDDNQDDNQSGSASQDQKPANTGNLASHDETHVSFERASQSDHLHIETATAEQDFKFAGGQGLIGPAFQYSRYDQNPYAANVYRPGLADNYNFSNQVAFTSVAGIDQIDATGFKNHTVATYNAFGTFVPVDQLHMYIGSSRNTFSNIVSLQDGIAATYFNGFFDFLPNQTTRFSLRGNEGLYTDGNERQWVQLETEKELVLAPAFFIGGRLTAIHFSRELNNGYFDPLRYGSAEVTSRIKTDLSEDWGLEVGTSLGVEGDSPGGGVRPTYDPNATLSYYIAKNMSLDTSINYYVSHLASDSGFSQLTFNIGLNYTWQ